MLDNLWTEANALRDGEMWWVAPEMTSLAVQAAASLPQWTPAHNIPAPTGILVWDGETRLSMPWDTAPEDQWERGAIGVPRLPSVPVRGVVWWSTAQGLGITALTDDARVVAEAVLEPRAGLTDLPLDDQPVLPLEQAPSLNPLVALVGATWLLAQQPGVGQPRRKEFDAPRPGTKGPGPVAPVTIVTLRELHNPQDPEGSAGRQGGYSHRWLVAGH
ncbi:hypothetical protein [Promicromonospora soli]